MIDFKVQLIDGAFHDVDSSVLAFEIAARAAMREGLKKAGAKMLEPVMKVEVVSPEEYTGSVIGDLTTADIILVGVSRTSKTPTSIYLANKGFKTANVPFVPGVPLPRELEGSLKALIVGLTAAPERLVEIRTNRLRAMRESPSTTYVDERIVREEVLACRRFCVSHGWPVIDVTRRSIEETAAAIVKLHTMRDAERTHGAD